MFYTTLYYYWLCNIQVPLGGCPQFYHRASEFYLKVHTGSNKVEHTSLLMHEELNLNRGLTCPHYLHLLFLDSENLRKEMVLWFNHPTVSYSKPQAGNPICSNK